MENNENKPKFRLSVALVHWPVLDKAGTIVATNITNFDIHDIARACRTYGTEKYHIVHKSKEQQMFVARVLDHWKVGKGSVLNPMRRTALTRIELDDTVESLTKKYNKKPILVATAARDIEGVKPVKFSELREKIFKDPETPVIVLFGTGFGLHSSVLEACDYILPPIKGSSEDDYRHLSVRSAVSICLDRLLGT